MALANQKYDVLLNGKGYILIEESYRKKSQQPFNARFSTGDYGFGDLSFWQFLVQEQWDAGNGLDIFGKVFYNVNQLNANLNSKNRIKDSVGWDFRSGFPQVSLGSRVVTLTGGINFTALTQTAFNSRAKLVPFGTNSGSIEYLLLVGGGAGVDGSYKTMGSDSPNDPYPGQVIARDAVVWSRNQLGSFLMVPCTIAGVETLRAYDPRFSNTDVVTAAPAGVTSKIVIPLTGNSIMILESDETNSKAYVRVIKFSNNSWSISTNLVSEIPYAEDFLAGAYAQDTNGFIYVVTQYSSGPNASGNNRLNQSRVLIFNPTDLTDTNGPRLTEVNILPNAFVATGIADVNGEVLIFGGIKQDNGNQYAAILKYPNEIIWTGPFSSNTDDNFIRAYSRFNRGEIHFVVRSTLGNYDSIMRIRIGDIVEEICAIPMAALGTFDNMAVGFWGNRFYWYRQASNALNSSSDARGSLDASGTEAILQTAEFGGNTPTINKTLYSVLIELDTQLPIPDTITVLVNDVAIGTMIWTDGLKKEMIAALEFTSQHFVLKIKLPRTTTWSGKLKRVTLRFIPVQYKKRAWAFGVRADSNLVLADGTRESMKAAEIFTNLQNAWISNIPLDYTDVDGIAYKVIVTDYDQRRPLLDRKGGVFLESFVFLELLEV